MPKKLTQQQIDKDLKQINLKALELYKNNRTRMKFKCSCGVEFIDTYNRVQQGYKCRECNYKRNNKWNSSHIDEIKEYYKSFDCELISTTYKNIYSCLKYKCSCGNIFKKQFRIFLTCKGCPSCNENLLNNITYKDVKEYIEFIGGKLVSTKYINSHEKLEMICKCGRKRISSFANIKLHENCELCDKYNKKTQEEVEQIFKDNGCEILSIYESYNSKIKFKCLCGNISEKTFGWFLRYPYCTKCGINRRSGKNHCKWIKNRELKKEKDIINSKMRSMLKHYLKFIKNKKNNKTYNILGYTPEDLYNHLNSFPEYKILKDTEWHLDHKVSIIVCLSLGITDPKIVNSLENLQPLSIEDNLKKSTKINKEFVYDLCNKYNIKIDESQLNESIELYGELI